MAEEESPQTYTVKFLGAVTQPSVYIIEKSIFIKNSVNSLSLFPLGHFDGFASCKALRVLISASLPKAPFPGKGAILLGLPPLDPVGGFAPATLFYKFFNFLQSKELYLNPKFSLERIKT